MLEFLLAGGPVMLLLLLTSLVSVTVILERSFALRRRRVVPSAIVDDLAECDTKEDLESLRLTCGAQRSTLGRLLLQVIDHLSWPKGENAESVQARARQEVVRLERGLVVLEVVVGIAPLLGLIGTIHGLITLFADLGVAASDSVRLARGIAMALNTTMAGLLIAIPSLVAWSYFNKKIERMTIEMEVWIEEFMRRQYRRRPRSPRVKAVAK